MKFPIWGSYHISQTFGNYSQMYDGILPNSKHNGIDVACKRGEPIHAVADGIIQSIQTGAKPDVGGYGNEVRLLTSVNGQRLQWVFAHMLTVLVVEGQMVKEGDVIGLVDSTGFSTGDHLHFAPRELDTNGNVKNYDNGFYGYFDPMPFFQPDASKEKAAVDIRYGQSRSLAREMKWSVVNRRYAARELPKHDVPFNNRTFYAFVYGGWDFGTVANPAFAPVWMSMTKGEWRSHA